MKTTTQGPQNARSRTRLTFFIRRLSLTPCFSGVKSGLRPTPTVLTVFSRASGQPKTVKTVQHPICVPITPLKRGVNESRLLGLLLLAAALASGCSTRAPGATRSVQPTTAKISGTMATNGWSLHGEIIDTCNCEVVCPCMVGSAPTHGACLTDVTWCIDDGHYGTVDLAGLIVVLAVHAPGPKFNDGHWRLAMYGDQRATPEQRQALETIFLGRAGGFFGPWRERTAELLGVRWPPIEVERAGRSRTVRIRNVLDIQAQALVGPNTNSFTELDNPPFWKGKPFRAKLGRSTEFRYRDYDLKWEAPRRACSFSEFRYEGP